MNLDLDQLNTIVGSSDLNKPCNGFRCSEEHYVTCKGKHCSSTSQTSSDNVICKNGKCKPIDSNIIGDGPNNSESHVIEGDNVICSGGRCKPGDTSSVSVTASGDAATCKDKSCNSTAVQDDSHTCMNGRCKPEHYLQVNCCISFGRWDKFGTFLSGVYELLLLNQ